MVGHQRVGAGDGGDDVSGPAGGGRWRQRRRSPPRRTEREYVVKVLFKDYCGTLTLLSLGWFAIVEQYCATNLCSTYNNSSCKRISIKQLNNLMSFLFRSKYGEPVLITASGRCVVDIRHFF